jgi:hypothetical protein
VANIALTRLKMPSTENPAYLADSGCIISVPGWTIHRHILSSESVTPRPPSFLNARRLRTCPKKATKDVTKESSMSLANTVVSSIALAGVRGPLLVMRLPQNGSRIANPKKIPEKTQENRQMTMTLMFSQVKRDW